MFANVAAESPLPKNGGGTEGHLYGAANPPGYRTTHLALHVVFPCMDGVRRYVEFQVFEIAGRGLFKRLIIFLQDGTVERMW